MPNVFGTNMNAIVEQRAILDRRRLLSKINGLFPQNNYGPAKREELLSLVKESFDNGFFEIEKRFCSNRKGLDVLKSNSFLVDQVIIKLWYIGINFKSKKILHIHMLCIMKKMK